MGILEKAEGIVTLGILGVIGYFAYVNWDKIIGGFCKIPGAAATGWCGDTSKALQCTLTMNDCWQLDPYATVDTVNCKCVLPAGKICQAGYHFNEIGFCVPDVPPQDCGSGYRKNPVTGECEIIIVDPPCSKFNGNFGLPQTCPDGTQVCDLRSCGTPEPPHVITACETYKSRILRKIYPSYDDCNYLKSVDEPCWNDMVYNGWCLKEGIYRSPDLEICPDGHTIVDLRNGLTLAEACKTAYVEPTGCDHVAELKCTQAGNFIGQLIASGLSISGCESQGGFIDRGRCINQQQLNYFNCLTQAGC